MKNIQKYIKVIDIVLFVLAIIHAAGYFYCWWTSPTESRTYAIVFLLLYICFKLFAEGIKQNKKNKEISNTLDKINDNLERLANQKSETS